MEVSISLVVWGRLAMCSSMAATYVATSCPTAAAFSRSFASASAETEMRSVIYGPAQFSEHTVSGAAPIRSLLRLHVDVDDAVEVVVAGEVAAQARVPGAVEVLEEEVSAAVVAVGEAVAVALAVGAGVVGLAGVDVAALIVAE